MTAGLLYFVAKAAQIARTQSLAICGGAYPMTQPNELGLSGVSATASAGSFSTEGEELAGATASASAGSFSPAPMTSLQAEIESAQRKVKTDAYQMSIGEIVSMYKDG